MSGDELPTEIEAARRALAEDLRDMSTQTIPIKAWEGSTPLLGARLLAVRTSLQTMETMVDVAVAAWPNDDMILMPTASVMHISLLELMQELQNGKHIALSYEVYWRTVCIAQSAMAFIRIFERTTKQSPLDMLQTVFPGHPYSPLGLRKLCQRLRAYTGEVPALDALIDALAESVMPAQDVIAAACDAAVAASKAQEHDVQSVVYDLTRFVRSVCKPS